ncbi:hypothetical protein, partial [Pseudomonas agarici]|uniref:hypothetical protein n=1 Tax=Pseudomonas agarici TaxID=46677 RepID=UPI001B7FA204
PPPPQSPAKMFPHAAKDNGNMGIDGLPNFSQRFHFAPTCAFVNYYHATSIGYCVMVIVIFRAGLQIRLF